MAATTANSIELVHSPELDFGFKLLDDIYARLDEEGAVQSLSGQSHWIIEIFEKLSFLEMKFKNYLEDRYDAELDIADYDNEIVEFVWNWLSMVLSRAMDTIVIHINDPRSKFGQLLNDQCRAMPDFVEIRSTNSS